MASNNINLDVAIGDKLDSTDLLKEQMKKLRMLGMIQEGSQEQNPERAQRRRNSIQMRDRQRRRNLKCNQQADGVIGRCQYSTK